MKTDMSYRIHILNKLRISISIENISICCQILYLLFTVMWWIQISLIKQVIVFVAMTVNIICQFYSVIVQILLHK